MADGTGWRTDRRNERAAQRTTETTENARGTDERAGDRNDEAANLINPVAGVGVSGGGVAVWRILAARDYTLVVFTTLGQVGSRSYCVVFPTTDDNGPHDRGRVGDVWRALFLHPKRRTIRTEPKAYGLSFSPLNVPLLRSKCAY